MLDKIEKENRQRVIDRIFEVPVAKSPKGWELVTHLAVGGLLYTSFSEQQEGKLLVISSSGKSIVNTLTGEKVFRDYDDNDFDERNLVCEGVDILEGEVLHLAGIGGGGMRLLNADGDHVELVAPEYPIYELIFQPDYKYFLLPRKREYLECFRIFRDYEIRSFGFSKSGKLLLVSTSSDLKVWKKIE